MDVQTDLWDVLKDWKARGWDVQLIAVRDGWGVRIETPNAFVMDGKTTGEMSLQFTTAIHPTPQSAVLAAAKVLR